MPRDLAPNLTHKALCSKLEQFLGMKRENGSVNGQAYSDSVVATLN